MTLRSDATCRGYGLAATLLAASMLLLFWPGVAMFDSVAQYRQALSGHYVDWHPPVMARLWALLLWTGGGQAPMFVLQAALYWIGFGLIAARLALLGRHGGAILALAIGAWPPFAGWEAAVLKDAQMASALLAAVGLVAWWRLDRRPLPWAARAGVAVLLLYATLVRANAVFATVPLGFVLFAGWDWRGWAWRIVAIGLVTLGVVAALPLANQRVLGAAPSTIGRSPMVFDIAGVVHHAGPAAAPVLPAERWQAMEAAHCATPILWDPLADGGRCGFVSEELARRAPGAALRNAWIGAVLGHPLAYGWHRVAHWNATMRWIVPYRFPLAIPPAGSEPNTLGLRSPGKAAARFDAFAGAQINGPLGAPILGFAVALAVLALARPDRSPAQAQAFALALSAAAMEASFLLVSVSSDWRYHFWSMLAALLAVALLIGEGLPRRGVWTAIAAVVLIGASASVARLTLPPVGDSYVDATGDRR